MSNIKKENIRIPIAILPYDEVDFKFVCNHYDVHLNGSCVYNNKLCEFINVYPEYNEEKDEFEEMFVKIYTLNWIEKIRWLRRQWLFEVCIGNHWSYGGGKKGNDFGHRKPKWLYDMLFRLYYYKHL